MIVNGHRHGFSGLNMCHIKITVGIVELQYASHRSLEADKRTFGIDSITYFSRLPSLR